MEKAHQTVKQTLVEEGTELKGTLGKVFQAAGVAIPPALRPA